MQATSNRELLRGKCLELPDVRSKVVRVFLSSTFSDTLAERDSLIECVFPKLKDYCREKYGLEFQYSDMRWGIQTESADNHSEVQTCLNEIDLCKKYSLATNFVVLLSHRYGSRPTPAIIRAPLFEQLQQIVRSNEEHEDDAELLAQWFRLDTNQLPAAYVLRAISSMFPQILSVNTTEMKQANHEWQKVNSRIRTCLRRAAAKCLEQGVISESEYDDFFISVTEKEIVKGILTTSNANQRALCFFREIEDIYEHLSDRKASKYIDLQPSKDDQPVLDHEAETLLNRLKHTRIPSVLKSENIFSYKVRWNSDGIDRHRHAEYIAQFNEDFYQAIRKQIDQCARSNAMMISDPLEREVLEHAIKCKTYIAKFHGRTDIINKLEGFIKNEGEHRPCIVYGASGCGKTSVLAKIAHQALDWWSDRSVSVILRFLGTTPGSSTVYKMLVSISEQICRLYNLTMEIYPNAVQLRHQLESHLFKGIPADEYLVLILDSIDQLESDAYDCVWLPAVYPKNVKCILSTLPDHQGILSNLQAIIMHSPSQPERTEQILVLVPPFEASTVEIVYNDWLTMKQRSLSDEQHAFIRELMQQQTEILPLFMKLIFDVICTWHSYDPIDPALRNLKTVDHCIKYLFNHLKTIHNGLLFTRAIIYMTSCRNGISQNELEDVLSLDDDVLKSVFQHYIPPVRRVPGILWTRIRNDLDEYITEKEADDSCVIYWYHRRFIEVANSEYIAKLNSEERKSIFQNMVDLYKETWKGKSKPFQIDNANLLSKYNLTESKGQMDANRHTTSQPIEFIDIHGQVQYNKRKLNELPAFLAALTAEMSIPIVAEEVFFNYPFMRAKIRCSSFNDIIDELQKFDQASSYRLSKESMATKTEIKIFSRVYLIAGIHLEAYPENFAFEICARLVSLFGTKPNTTRLIKQTDDYSAQHGGLVVPYVQLQPPGSGLVFSMHMHTSSVVDMDFTDAQMTSISLSDRIIVLDMSTVKIMSNINLPVLDEPYLNSTTLTRAFSVDEKGHVTSTGSSAKDEPQHFKKFLFLVNSLHHTYLVNTQEHIKFERSSKTGFQTIEFIDEEHGLCVLAEIDGHSVECWNIITNRLFGRIDFPSAPIKNVRCVCVSRLIVTLLQDGSLHYHAIRDHTSSTFVHCGSMKANPQLDSICVIGQLLFCTFDTVTPIDFAVINSRPLADSEQTLRDEEIFKTLITFDPPITAVHPIKRIELPNDNEPESKRKQEGFPFFAALTSESLYLVHQCKNGNVSYLKIDGEYDVVYLHVSHQYCMYTARGCIIDMYKWACIDPKSTEPGNHPCLHKYQLYISIDVNSAPVTTITAAADGYTIFLCSLENGMMQAYSTKQAREALAKVPTFPRVNQKIHALELLQATAVTLDTSRRELSTWSYRHSSRIESTRFSRDAQTIVEFGTAPCKTNTDTILILLLTSHHHIEIYSSQSLAREPLFTHHLRSPAKIHSTQSGTFLLLTNKGSIHCITEQVSENDPPTFHHKVHLQLPMPCAKMLSTVISIDSTEYLIVVADNGGSLAAWTSERVINIAIPPLTSSLTSVTGERTHHSLLLHLQDHSLVSCRVNLDSSIRLTTFTQVDRFALKNNRLVTLNNKTNHLDLVDLHSSTSHTRIQLENHCEHLCLNESGRCVFALVSPRVLYMYRFTDGRPVTKLFLNDLVCAMRADDDFLVLAMVDRRLLTLMIADPDDPTVSEKIRALPSRNEKPVDEVAMTDLIKHLDNMANDDSSEEDDKVNLEADEDEMKKDQLTKNPIQKCVAPISRFRFVTRLAGEYSPSKMSDEKERRRQMLDLISDRWKDLDVSSLADDDDDVVQPTVKDFADDVKDINEKVVQHDQEQLRGIQFANAGSENLKVVNSYSVSSKSCTLI